LDALVPKALPQRMQWQGSSCSTRTGLRDVSVKFNCRANQFRMLLQYR
jgi:hypothetical protein